jgi:hypothetical protein
MFKYLLVSSTGSELDRPGVEMALRAANPSSAHIEFLHVRMDIRQVMVMLAGSGMTLGTGLVGLEQEADERERRAREGFRAFCTEHKLNPAEAPGAGLSVSWSVMTGEEPVCLVERARVADAIVLGRGEEGDLFASEVLARAVMGTGRPVLITPSAEAPDKLHTAVAIAWKDRPEAARAVTAAMPLIAEAERVVILSVSEHGGDGDESGRRLRHALQWHNPNVSLERLPRWTPGAPHLDGSGRRTARIREPPRDGRLRSHALAGSRLGRLYPPRGSQR